MTEGDFELETLANYLHLPQTQVLKMADRGQLPGRKVGGAWRFAQAEIHRWMELRIGEADEGELERLAGVLERRASAQQVESLGLDELLPVEAMAVPLAARTRSSVISSMVDLAAVTGWLWDPPQMVEAVRLREELSPTALDNGVALLHPRRPLKAVLAQPLLAFGRTEQGIPFGAERGGLTDLFFLICSVDDQQHLRTLARLSRVINDAALLDQLRQAADVATARTLLLDRERLLHN